VYIFVWGVALIGNFFGKKGGYFLNLDSRKSIIEQEKERGKGLNYP